MTEKQHIYLDNAATTPVDPEVLKVMTSAYEKYYGNTESVHQCGFEAHQSLQKARETIADLIRANPKEIIFTSGGTESDNMAVQGVCRKFIHDHPGERAHVITSSIEHPAVLNSCKAMERNGIKVTYLPVDKYGMISLDDLKESIETSDEKVILISIMHANNEIGTIQPIQEIGKIAREHNILFHTDAVQSFGKEKIDVEKLNLDMMSVSAHKIYGPKGVGFLYVKNCGRKTPIAEWDENEPEESDFYLEKIMHGGRHEFNWRPSTVNVPGILGLAKAAELAYTNFDEETRRLRRFQEDLISWVLENIKGSVLNGHPKHRLVNNMNFSIKRLDGNELYLGLDIDGFAISTGSACATKSEEVSHVIRAIGLEPKFAQGTVRITTGRFNTAEDIQHFKDGLQKVVKALRTIRQKRGLEI